ncbi:MAG: hypothetical protein Udaeo2_20760 [Candidatus Udaeobacter sp.]|nr:MAG: hypothetical protein Udaeo2_20760 [Candidatus Udaeobacter sp.]
MGSQRLGAMLFLASILTLDRVEALKRVRDSLRLRRRLNDLMAHRAAIVFKIEMSTKNSAITGPAE